MVKSDIVVKATCTRITFNKDDFYIAQFHVDEVLSGHVKSSGYSGPNNITAKGLASLKEGLPYKITGKLEENAKWGAQYQIIDIVQDIDLANGTKADFKLFLEAFTSERNTRNILKTLDNPAKVFATADIKALTAVPHIGEKTAQKLMVAYKKEIDVSAAYIEFKKMGFAFTNPTVRKICNHFGSADLAIKKVGEDPYVLMKIERMGFTTVDSWALDTGISPNDPRRVHAYVENEFEVTAAEGNSWISAKEFFGLITQNIPNLDLREVISYINQSGDYVVLEDKEAGDRKLSLKRWAKKEELVAAHLNRLLNTDKKPKYNNVDRIIANIEKKQGWQYSDDQRQAIDDMLENNVYLLQGLAGTGKSSTIHAVVEVLKQNGKSFVQCALSGKAANNLSQITGQNGSTIHRLLEPRDNGKFAYNVEHKLETDVVILDELSMVELDIFLALIQALNTGTKLIMIGDMGQLQPIGIGVMSDILESGVIPSTYLIKQHRQAKRSGISSHSVVLRRGEYPEDLTFQANTKRQYGEIGDLEYIMVKKSEQEKLLPLTIKVFEKKVAEYGLDNVQIICSAKASGPVSVQKINLLAQMKVNPSENGKPEITIKQKEFDKTLRLGDRVLNTRNTRSTFAAGVDNYPTERKMPIYNGNTGVIIYINDGKLSDDDPFVVIDFDGIGRVAVSKDHLKYIDLGYAMTVHKSQGSTIQCVIFALPYHYLLNSRELVYTGMTRASKDLTVLTAPYALKLATEKVASKKRNTNLLYYIRKQFGDD